MGRATPAKAKSADGMLRRIESRVAAALTRLKRQGSKQVCAEMGARYGIVTKDVAYGVSMAKVQKLAKEVGRDHAFAAALWKTRVYEGRMLAIHVAEPARVTPAQMDAWARDFDNWATCDTACFKLFDQTPHAWGKIEQWARRREEFVKRAAFALLASVALHRKDTDSEQFLKRLPLIEEGARDERNFVKKGVSWALRGVGGRNDRALRRAALAVAQRLAASDDAAARWVGKDALKALGKG